MMWGQSNGAAGLVDKLKNDIAYRSQFKKNELVVIKSLLTEVENSLSSLISQTNAHSNEFQTSVKGKPNTKLEPVAKALSNLIQEFNAMQKLEFIGVASDNVKKIGKLSKDSFNKLSDLKRIFQEGLFTQSKDFLTQLKYVIDEYNNGIKPLADAEITMLMNAA